VRRYEGNNLVFIANAGLLQAAVTKTLAIVTPNRIYIYIDIDKYHLPLKRWDLT
jgi:hypothetical protein